MDDHLHADIAQVTGRRKGKQPWALVEEFANQKFSKIDFESIQSFLPLFVELRRCQMDLYCRNTHLKKGRHTPGVGILRSNIVSAKKDIAGMFAGHKHRRYNILSLHSILVCRPILSCLFLQLRSISSTRKKKWGLD